MPKLIENKYYIVYNPITYNLMDSRPKCHSPRELLEYLTGRDAAGIDAVNYLEYLLFDRHMEKKGMIESMSLENYALPYVANQIVRQEPGTQVILADGNRRSIYDIIRKNGKPAALFISSMSSNFPTAVCTALALNYAAIPIVIGGIHVSTTPQDVDTFIRKHVPNPNLVSLVRGACDKRTIQAVLTDIANTTLKPEYVGHDMIEDGAWGHNGIDYMVPLEFDFLDRIPFIGMHIKKRIRFNSAAPFLGCPYSCKFCSISSIPRNQRRFVSRSPKDFADELSALQKDGVTFKNRMYFFIPDNLLVGGKHLDAILDELIARKLRINYAAQISIDVADNEPLLDKLRRSGATHFFIGFESLDLRNLYAIGKNAAHAIAKSKMSPKQYYAKQIRVIQRYGISIHGAFILGLPYDYFNSMTDNSGRDISDFCIENHIGIQATPLSDVPGSQQFIESIQDGTFLYGKPGTMDYLIALCACDMTESNRISPENLKKSPLIATYMAFDAIRRVGETGQAVKSGLYMIPKAFLSPTLNGRIAFRERVNDTALAFISQLIASLYKDHAEKVVSSSNGIRGSFERLYEMESDMSVKKIFQKYVDTYIAPLRLTSKRNVSK